MKAHVLDLMGKEHPVRVLLLLRQAGAMRFTEIEQALGLNPSQVDRALKVLRAGVWIVPETVPVARGPVHVQYRIGKRGAALLRAVDAFRDELDGQRATLGDDVVAEVEALYA